MYIKPPLYNKIKDFFFLKSGVIICEESNETAGRGAALRPTYGRIRKNRVLAGDTHAYIINNCGGICTLPVYGFANADYYGGTSFSFARLFWNAETDIKQKDK